MRPHFSCIQGQLLADDCPTIVPLSGRQVGILCQLCYSTVLKLHRESAGPQGYHHHRTVRITILMNKMTMNTAMSSSRIKNTSRFALAALLLALAWAAISSRSDAQQPLGVRVVGPGAPVAAGQPFVVTIAIDNVQDLGAFEFEYNFNPAIATTAVSNIQLGSMLGSSGRTTGELRMASAPGRPGVPLFGAYSYGAAAGPLGSGVLATVTMTAVAPGASPLSLTGLKVTNVSGDEYTVAVTSGSVTVGATPRMLYLPLLRRSN